LLLSPDDSQNPTGGKVRKLIFSTAISDTASVIARVLQLANQPFRRLQTNLKRRILSLHAIDILVQCLDLALGLKAPRNARMSWCALVRLRLSNGKPSRRTRIDASSVRISERKLVIVLRISSVPLADINTLHPVFYAGRDGRTPT
jgi:hypothetical protein